MTTLHMIGLALAALGVVGGLGTGAFLLMGGIAAPLALGGIVQAFRGLWAFLNSTLGHLVLAAVLAAGMFVGGVVHATRRVTARYEAQIAESIRKNAEFDKQLQDETAAKAREQEQAASDRVRAAEQKVQEYEELYKSCTVGDAAADWLNGLPAPARVIAKPPKPPRRP